MKFFLLLFFAAALMSGCENIKSKKKDPDDRKTERGLNDNKGEKDEEAWTDEQREEVMGECIKSEKKSQAPARWSMALAEERCSCMTDFLIKNLTYDEYDEFFVKGRGSTKDKSLKKKMDKLRNKAKYCLEEKQDDDDAETSSEGEEE